MKTRDSTATEPGKDVLGKATWQVIPAMPAAGARSFVAAVHAGVERTYAWSGPLDS